LNSPKHADTVAQVPSVDPNLHDRFFLSQRYDPTANQYDISTLGIDGKSAGEPVCFVHQARMKLREDLRAVTYDSQAVELFRIHEQLLWHFHAKYDVTDSGGRYLGELRRVFGKALLRNGWHIYDASGNHVASARERSATRSLLGRFVTGVLPVSHHFDYFIGEQRIGTLERIPGMRDRYRLDVSGDAGRQIDRRMVLALAVGMEALHER
jgi:hypothetical protein